MGRWAFEWRLVWWVALVAGWAAMAGAAHPHDEPHQAAAVEVGQAYAGLIDGATGEPLTYCDPPRTCDVWHQVTIPSDGLFTILAVNHTFHVVLGVFDPCGMGNLACNDGSGVLGSPRIQMPATGGTRLLIRVAAYAGSIGRYELLVSRADCDGLSPVLTPSPADGAEAVLVNTGLRWDGAPAPVGRTEDESPGPATPSRVRAATVYGPDDRQDEYEVHNEDVRLAGRAVAMIVSPDRLLDNGDGTFTLFCGSLAEMYAARTGRLLCPEERFRDQPAPGTATGFLVAPQILATVGHVVAGAEQARDLVVFDFAMTDANTAPLVVRPEQLYVMKKVLAYHDGIPDWAVVQLDRPVTGREPLHLRRQGRVADDASDLLAIGHPLGLPRKYSTGGTALANAEPAFFETDLDVNLGSSGSPVLRHARLQVEGIVFSGNEDFIPNAAYHGLCDSSLSCPDEQGRCNGWEWIARATCFSPLVPAYDVYLGPDPTALVQVASDLNVPWLTPSDLQPGTTYYWQVRAHTAEGVTLTPTWSFRTEQ